MELFTSANLSQRRGCKIYSVSLKSDCIKQGLGSRPGPSCPCSDNDHSPSGCWAQAESSCIYTHAEINCLNMVVLMLLGWQTEPIDVSSTASPMQNAFYFWKSLEVKKIKSPGTVYLMLCFWVSLMHNSMLSSLKIKNNPFLLLCWVFSKKFMHRWKQIKTMPSGSEEILSL